MMARIIKKQCPVFLEEGEIKVTTEYGSNIADYPTAGKTGDHWGLDIVRSVNGDSETATIIAIADGVVKAQRKWVKDGEKTPTAGNCVYITHKNGMVSKYFHLKEATVPEWIKDNIEIKKGDKLGYMGNTGNSYGSHLHFQVEDTDGNTVDPEPYILGEKTFDDLKKYTVAVDAAYVNRGEAEQMAALLEGFGIKSVVNDF